MANKMRCPASVKPILRPIGVFSLALVLSLTLVISSLMFKHNAVTNHSEIDQQIKNTTAALNSIRTDQEAIAEYFDEYIQLKSSGVIGKENRLRWTESVKAISREMNIEDLQYAISRQQRVSDNTAFNAAPYEQLKSIMKINTQLHNVVELMNFFEKLRAAQVGIFNVNQCELDLQPFDRAELPKTPMVQAECELVWLTLEPKSL